MERWSIAPEVPEAPTEQRASFNDREWDATSAAWTWSDAANLAVLLIESLTSDPSEEQIDWFALAVSDISTRYKERTDRRRVIDLLTHEFVRELDPGRQLALLRALGEMDVSPDLSPESDLYRVLISRIRSSNMDVRIEVAALLAEVDTHWARADLRKAIQVESVPFVRTAIRELLDD